MNNNDNKFNNNDSIDALEFSPVSDSNDEKDVKDSGNETAKTTSFDSKHISKVKSNEPQKMDLSANMKKAAVKKAAKKSAKTSLFVLNKASQWIFNIFATVLLMCVICGVIVGGAFGIYIMNDLVDSDYDLQELHGNLKMTSEIYYTDEDGNDVLYSKVHGTENRSWVSYEDIPEDLINAFLAIEDERYWEHNGVDWRRTFGAALSFITGTDDYGGSTITQQLIKNVTGESDTTIQRKITEISRALSVSEKRTKEEVLEMYLNRIHLSRSNYGIGAAADFYFGKDVSELTLAECACLASIPQSPTKFDPYRNPDNNKDRREDVLWKMNQLGWITDEEYEAALKEEVLIIGVNKEREEDENGDLSTDAYSYFQDALIEQLIEDLNEEYGYTREYASNLILSGGLKIYTTMDKDIQDAMEEVFEDPDSFAKVDDGIQPQSAMVIMDPSNGHVLGLVGGRGEKTGKLELNRATQSVRQVGSSIKPLTVYAPAIEKGKVVYSTVLDDTPIYMDKMNRYWPSNSPNRYVGKITVDEAVVLSKNTTAVKLVKDELGVDYVYDFAKNKLHLDSLVASDRDIAPLALGGFTHGLTVMEMTAAYCIFPSGGEYHEPKLYTKVLNNDGTILLLNEEVAEPVISEGTSTVMTKILQDVVSRGTAAAITLDQKVNCAGKTGSTNDNKDVYFAGFTPYYVGACWFGYDAPKDLYRFKTNQAMLAWEKVMAKVHQKHFDKAASGEEALKTFDFSKLKTASFCLDSGLLPCEACSMDVRGTSRIATGYYYNGKGMPTRTCDVHVKVDWCTESNYLANPYCPEECRKEVSLIKEYDRSFTHGNIQVADAFYTYRRVNIDNYEDIPDSAPFYRSLLEEGEHIGYVENASIINRMCLTHTPPVEEPEPGEGGEDGEGSESGGENGEPGGEGGEPGGEGGEPGGEDGEPDSETDDTGSESENTDSTGGVDDGDDDTTGSLSGENEIPADNHPTAESEQDTIDYQYDDDVFYFN